MELGLTELTYRPPRHIGLWLAAAARVRRWVSARRARREQRRLAASPLSADWLRRHEVESAKHRDAFYG